MPIRLPRLPLSLTISAYMSVFLLCGSAQADDNSASNNNKSATSKSSAKKSEPRKATEAKLLNPALEKQTLQFVSENEPKLNDLLGFLKEKQPRIYQQAMREMARAQQRLNQLKDKDEQQYELELKLWKSRSRQRLLAAEIASGKSKNEEQQLKELENLVKRQASLEIQKLKLLKSRAEKQVERVKKQIADREKGEDAFVERTMKTWLNQINKNQNTKGPRKVSSK